MHHEYGQTLRDLRLKITPKRVAILDILRNEQVYLSPEEVWKKMKKRFARIGLPTVYRNLEDLAGGGVITKVVHPNRQLYYYFCRKKGHHHHFICLSCRKVEDINYCGGTAIEGEVRKGIKGVIISHIIQVNGLCRHCAFKKGGQ